MEVSDTLRDRLASAAGEEEEMVEIYLENSVGRRLPGQATASKIYGPGRCRVPKSFAEAIGARPIEEEAAGAAQVRLNQEAAALPGGTAANAQDVDAPPAEPPAPEEPAGTSPYDGKKVKELKALADKRGIPVTRGDGQDGEPLLADYRKALEDADAAEQGQ